jgi:hypothetical protein
MKDKTIFYLVISCALFGFVYFYPEISERFNLIISYKYIVIIGAVIIMLVITPLWWKSMQTKSKEEREKYHRPEQPWE